MNMKKLTTLLILAVFTLAAPAAMAQSALKLTTLSEMQVVEKDAQGNDVVKMIPAAKVIPGDQVIYTIVYDNAGEQPAADAVITDPVPEHMFYVDGTAKGVGCTITFSIDGGRTFDFPGNLKVKNDDGSERTARANEYTTIRWTLNAPVPPGAKGSVAFTAQLQ